MDIQVSEDLWASSMFPEGTVERWLVADGARVIVGDPIAQVRIEDARHDVMATASGRLTIAALPNSLIEPGSILGRIDILRL